MNISTQQFDWGSLPEIVAKTIATEIQSEKVYEYWNSVQEGDIVVDIGASVGAFTCAYASKSPKEIFCIEPSAELISTLQSNCKTFIDDKRTKVQIINSAISNKPEEKLNVFTFSDQQCNRITFKSFIEQYNLQKIDFLKIDCEGGEYDIFTEENLEFLQNNVGFIACEFHLNYPDNREKFKNFRDNILPKFKNAQIVSCKYQRISPGYSIDLYPYVFDEYFAEHYDCEFMVYVNNTCSRIKNEKINYKTKVKNKKIFVVEDFYDDPHEIRDFALRQEYNEGGFGRGYIGRRTQKQFLFPGLKQRFEEIIGQQIYAWESHGMNGRFQIAYAGEPLVYHCDEQRWAGMLYLTPDAPFQTGTTLYAHKQTKIRHASHPNILDTFVKGSQNLDKTPYEPVDVIGNVYNRLVIFDALSIHAASEYFGFNNQNARLWQMFFFD